MRPDEPPLEYDADSEVLVPTVSSVPRASVMLCEVILIADVKCRGNELLLNLRIDKGIARRVLGRTVKLIHAVELLNSKVIERDAKAIEIVLIGAAEFVRTRWWNRSRLARSCLATGRRVARFTKILAGQLVADAVGDIFGQALIDRVQTFRRRQATLDGLVGAVGMLTVAARKRIIQIDVVTLTEVLLKAFAGVVPVQKVLGVVTSAIAKDVIGKRCPVGQHLLTAAV